MSNSDLQTVESSLANSILKSCTEYSIIATDLDAKIITWNEGACRLYDYDSEEMVGKASLCDIYNAEDSLTGKFLHILDTAKQAGIWRGELNCRGKGDKPVFILSTVTLRTDLVGKPIGYTVIDCDQTEFSNKLKTLTESKEYTRSLIESNIDVLITTDSLGIITDVNKQFCVMTERSLQELIGSPFKGYFTDPKRAEDLIRKVLSAKRIANYELVIQSLNNNQTPVSFGATTFHTVDGHLKGIFTTARDITEQKRLEEESKNQSIVLLKTTNLLKDVLKSSIAYSMIAQDLDGTILLWNEGAKRTYGYTADDMVGKKNLYFLNTPEDIQSGLAKQMLDETLKTGRSDGVVEHIRKNGDRFPAMYSVTTRRDEEGSPIGYVIISKDISIQKQQEQELREQLSYNRSLFESSIDVLIAMDTLGIITDANKQMSALTGYQLEELIGTEFKNYFSNSQQAENCIRNVLADEIVKNYELTIKAKDGKETVMSCNATTFKGTDQTLRGVFAVARDITEQKRLEEESSLQNRSLNEATGFLNNVLESSTAYSIIAEDLEGNILAWNEGARINYGYTAEEMIGKQNTSILHAPEDIASGRLQTVLDSALKTGKEEGVLESVRKNGERFTASLALTLRKDANGNPVGYVLISKDITDQKREEVLVTKNVELEEQNRLAQEANRLKSEFLANMSHELRSPLNGIIGFAELMHLGKVGPVSPEHKEYLADILSSSRHLLQLINDILDLAKVESGKMEFHPETLDINVIITEVCDILRTLIAKSKIRLNINVDQNISTIIIDPGKLKQVLYNYISNAIKFTQEEGSINIRVYPEGANFFRLEVEDSGIGISEHDIPKLFAEFQQLDSSLNKKYQGTGLGLALTRRIAEALGGQIGVKSILGKGSTFYITLPKEPLKIASGLPLTTLAPRVSDDLSLTPIESNPIPLTNTTGKIVNEEHLALKNSNVDSEIKIRRVLVIEDNPDDNKLIVDTLSSEGYEVEVAFNGTEAIKLTHKHRFDLITLDLLLPDMNGWEILKAFRSKGPNLETPSIVVTVVGSKAISFGFMIQNFLTKPIKSEDLIIALEQTEIYPNENKTILFIDDNPQMLSLCKQYLKDYGSTILCESDAEEALSLAIIKHPDVIILDLLMPKMDGLEFLRRFRCTEIGIKTPVIICTSQDMGDIDRKRIKASVAAVVQKGGGSMSNLMVEIKRIFPPSMRIN
jgi:PAS domain S-box-containing protein